ncbi:MAG: type III secretion system stator protein SctL [Rouxiella aceris]|uniref:type III secretion system stator protein SctL n=1 Tax=Rouxiella aceris TaxID=2703884 RepID=UPI00284F9939|nr:type III secretion system stator protein SctL [Rouxiella aceris]MDR3431859.1 type III secretion system stator protein SctL [Rouxiella aceris]
MWIKKKLRLPLDNFILAGPILHAPDIEACQKALAIEKQAKANAKKIGERALKKAEQSIEEKIKRQEGLFCEQIRLFFLDWEKQRHQWQEDLLSQSEQLISQALSVILNEIAPRQRIQAVLRQLLRLQVNQHPATLYCSPAQLEEVKQGLAEQTHLNWQVQGDPGLAADHLLLTTERGEWQTSWSKIVAHLLSSPSGQHDSPINMPSDGGTD